MAIERLIIAGGRDYIFDTEEIDFLDSLGKIKEVVCGMAPGADTCGANWAKMKRIPVKEFPAKWSKYGRAAGPARNWAMAQYATALALFPGGKGSADMKTKAKRARIDIFEFEPVKPSDNS